MKSKRDNKLKRKLEDGHGVIDLGVILRHKMPKNLQLINGLPPSLTV